MKAILVLDLGNADSDYYYIDYVVRNKEIRNTLMCGYNVNLKPLPQYMTMRNTVSCDYNEAFVNGFNYCIDEIVELERPLFKKVYEEIEKLFDEILGEKYEHNCKKN